jgi:glycosyltransferase involved in cell wall biosynthesis
LSHAARATRVRVLAIVPYTPGRAPGQRYRIEQWARYLSAEGIDVEFAPFLPSSTMDILYRPGHLLAKAWGALAGYARRPRDVVRAGSFDVAFLYREATPLGPAWIERVLASRVPIVYDFDDAIYLRATSPANAWVRALKNPEKTASLCRLSRHVVVGNDILAAYARRYANAVSVVPSTIDTDAYVLMTRPANPRPVLGWTGSSTTLPHLAVLRPALARLRQLLDYELRIIGGDLEVPGVRVTCLPWRAETEVDDLRAIDVGLMPLPDDAWSRGKCAMKALQYMALAIPPVVSPVGANATVVEDGVNGLHAVNESEWVERLAALLGEPSRRASLGSQARRTVEERYSCRVQAPRVARILREAARRRILAPGRDPPQ